MEYGLGVHNSSAAPSVFPALRKMVRTYRVTRAGASLGTPDIVIKDALGNQLFHRDEYYDAATGTWDYSYGTSYANPTTTVDRIGIPATISVVNNPLSGCSGVAITVTVSAVLVDGTVCQLFSQTCASGSYFNITDQAVTAYSITTNPLVQNNMRNLICTTARVVFDTTSSNGFASAAYYDIYGADRSTIVRAVGGTQYFVQDFTLTATAVNAVAGSVRVRLTAHSGCSALTGTYIAYVTINGKEYQIASQAYNIATGSSGSWTHNISIKDL